MSDELHDLRNAYTNSVRALCSSFLDDAQPEVQAARAAMRSYYADLRAFGPKAWSTIISETAMTEDVDALLLVAMASPDARTKDRARLCAESKALYENA